MSTIIIPKSCALTIVIFIVCTISMIAQGHTPVALPPTNTTATSFVANVLSLQKCCSYYYLIKPAGAVLDVASDSNFTEPSYLPGFRRKFVSSTSNIVTDLMPDSTYFYRFVYVDSLVRDAIFSTVQRIRTLSSPIPGVPIPTVFAITDNGFTLRWQPVPKAEYYLLDVFLRRLTNRFPGSDTVFITQNIRLTDTQYVVRKPSDDMGTYFYRVRAANAFGMSSYNTCGGCRCMHTNGIYILNVPYYTTITDSIIKQRLKVDAVGYDQTPKLSRNDTLSYISFAGRLDFVFLLQELFASQIVDTVWVDIERQMTTSGLYCYPEGRLPEDPLVYQIIAHTTDAAKLRQLFSREVIPNRYSFIPSNPLYYWYTLNKPTGSKDAQSLSEFIPN